MIDSNKRIRIGVICPSEIAIRRFMPALEIQNNMTFSGVGICGRDERANSSAMSDEEYAGRAEAQMAKARTFVSKYGGHIYDTYKAVTAADDNDAVYIPLPPALHYRWALKTLEQGKHVLLEKPATTSLDNTKTLVEVAQRKKLTLHENYMFLFHSQLEHINQLIQSGEIGDIRLMRISFGFPRRAEADFRYNKQLGGGALLDAGGYTIRYATYLLGESAKLVHARANYCDNYDVDIYGSAVMENDGGQVAQLAFGMDNDYKCELEVWGSKGTLYTNRVLTAPVGYEPIVRISKNGIAEEIKLESDDSFRKSIEYFYSCIMDERIRQESYQSILHQAELVEQFIQHSGLR